MIRRSIQLLLTTAAVVIQGMLSHAAETPGKVSLDGTSVMTGNLTTLGISVVSSMTVQGNAFSVGGTTLAVSAGHVGINMAPLDGNIRLSVSGIIKSSGPYNSLMFGDRGNSAHSFEWYSSGDIARLYSSVSAKDVAKISSLGALETSADLVVNGEINHKGGYGIFISSTSANWNFPGMNLRRGAGGVGTLAKYLNFTFPGDDLGSTTPGKEWAFWLAMSSFTATSQSDSSTNMSLMGPGKLGIGTTSPAKKVHIHSASADNHLYLSSVGPNVYFSNSETLSGTTQYGIFALATAAGQYNSLNAGDFLALSNHDMYLTANYMSSGNDLILQPASGPGAGGNVGIGTVTPSYHLDVYGSGAALRVNGNGTASHLFMAKSGSNYAQLAADGTDTYFDYGGSIGRLFFRAGVEGTTKVTFGSGGEIYSVALAGAGNRPVYSDSAGQLTNSSSDYRLKKDVVSLSTATALGQTLQLRPVTFHWNTALKRAESLGNQQEIGLIAQEVEGIVPQVVGENADGYKSLDYAKLVPVLIGAVQAQQEEIAALKKRVEILEAK